MMNFLRAGALGTGTLQAISAGLNWTVARETPFSGGENPGCTQSKSCNALPAHSCLNSLERFFSKLRFKAIISYALFFHWKRN